MWPPCRNAAVIEASGFRQSVFSRVADTGLEGSTAQRIPGTRGNHTSSRCHAQESWIRHGTWPTWACVSGLRWRSRTAPTGCTRTRVLRPRIAPRHPEWPRTGLKLGRRVRSRRVHRFSRSEHSPTFFWRAAARGGRARPRLLENDQGALVCPGWQRPSGSRVSCILGACSSRHVAFPPGWPCQV